MVGRRVSSLLAIAVLTLFWIWFYSISPTPHGFKRVHPILSGIDKGYITIGNMVVHSGHSPNPHRFVFLRNPESLCRGNILVVILVVSHVSAGLKRKIIRETWALRMLQESLRFRVVFLIGQAATAAEETEIQEEEYQHGDLVQENFTDDYRRLSVKTVMGLRWATSYCKRAKFVVKVDDDIFLYVPNLVRLLHIYAKDALKRPLIICHLNRWRKIIRNEKDMEKYQVLSKELPVTAKLFPPYCGGFMYIASLDAASMLYNASFSTPLFFLEDVYVTGFCRYKVGIDLIDVGAISLRPALTAAQASCAFQQGRVTSQELTSDEMMAVWKAINSREFFCPEMIRKLK